MFNQQEVQILLGGVNAPVDLDDLRANTSYGGAYNDEDPTITCFWDVRVLVHISMESVADAKLLRL
jgi:ubiquitin-protein ligase E3 C